MLINTRSCVNLQSSLPLPIKLLILVTGGFVMQWMYIIPFGLILVNAITSIANMPEEPAGGQGAAPAGAVPQRIAGAGGARRR